MLVKEFKGHKLCNSAAAIAFYYPAVSNGEDMINDFVGTVDNPAKVYPVMLKCYVAFRMAGDEEARKMSKEEILNEVNLFDPEEAQEFLKVVGELLNEKSKKD